MSYVLNYAWGESTIYLNELMKTEDAHEGVLAFIEKRKPEWRNK